MKLSRTLPLVVGLLSCSLLPSMAQKSTVSPFAKGCSQMQHKNFQGAISSFSEAIADDINDVNAYFRRGQSFFCLGNYAEAIRDFDHAAAKGAMDPNLYVWTGTAYASMSNDPQAIINYEKAMRLNPKLAGKPSTSHPDDALNSDVKLDDKNSLDSSAKQVIAKAVKDNPEEFLKRACTSERVVSTPFTYQVGQNNVQNTVAVKSTKDASAIEKTETSTTGKSEATAESNDHKTSQTLTVGSSRNAVADYQTAAKNVLENMTGSFIPGVVYSGIKNQSGAVVDLGAFDVGDAAIISKSGKPNDSSLRAALRKLDDSINAQPQDAKLYFQRARVYLISEKSSEGLGDLTRAIDLDKTNPHYYLARAFYYYQHDLTKDADGDIRQAQELNPIIPGELSFELSDKAKSEKKL